MRATLATLAVVGLTWGVPFGPWALAEESPPLAPTHANVSYGPHERNVLDFWQAEGEGPRPVLVFIHGGGWTAGDKQQNADRILPFLARGVSYAAINYRFTTQAPLPAPVHDAARAIQFLRTQAEPWRLDPDRIALTGGSAGACTSMWLLLHDDLADPSSADPLLRQSTRVAAAAVSAGQTALDPKVIEPWIGPKVLDHRMIPLSVGEPTLADALARYEAHQADYREFSPINHVDGGDPPLMMLYDRSLHLPADDASHGIHHPMFGLKLKEKSDRAGHECHLLVTSKRGVDAVHPAAMAFLLEKLRAE